MKKVSFAAIAMASLLMQACSPAVKKQVDEQVMETHVLHENDVKTLTPDSVLMILIEGNNNFATKNTNSRDVLE